ncbi:hypothetical protein [Pelagicoccus mobilis]|uniref:Uncharacterized protein n=1 Tax=Pelagicoccus mobilis TaxID=415221 RepID=A0A934RY60_9BACT|nr:hypothetical protein [Pelagicoccus mobilis]MBK1878503.1 hypothetical protein [Pelagicoccus mobilis]
MNLAVGESFEFLGHEVELEAIDSDWAQIRVDDESERIPIARRVLPVRLNGVRIYVCDTKRMANYTVRGPYGSRNAVTKDALFCLSNANDPLLDPETFTFPVDRSDGFEWSMAESSHSFAFLSPWRQHEGTDISLMNGKANRVDALVAMEDSRLVWIREHSGEQACLCLESASMPGVYYIYQHMETSSIEIVEGQELVAGQRLGYIWGDDRWGHLHLSLVAWGETPTYENRYGNSVTLFPMLYELWNGDLEPRPKSWTWGAWPFARNRAVVENVKRLNAFDPLLGYGWNLGDWCPAKKVEPVESGDNFSSALLKKKLFEGTVSEAENPEDYYEFEIVVPDGRYAVSALLGDVAKPTWQRIEFESMDVGVFDMSANEFRRSRERIVSVQDGRLTIRIYLKNDRDYASLSELSFCFLDRRTKTP